MIQDEGRSVHSNRKKQSRINNREKEEKEEEEEERNAVCRILDI